MCPSRILLCSIAGALALGGCATLSAQRRAPVSIAAAAAGEAQGAHVLWAGQVAYVSNHAQRSCALIQARPAAAGARPDMGAPSPGYFIACRSGRYDPYQVYAGRRVTVGGTIAAGAMPAAPGSASGYAVVAVNDVHAWGASRADAPNWICGGRCDTSGATGPSYPLAPRTP